MFNPLSLRLCCLATMAPALTSEAATRTRDKLPGAPTPPIAQVPLVNGRDCQGSSKGISDLGSSSLPVSVTNSSQLITITKDLQRKLVATGHLSSVDNSLQVTAEQQKSKQIGIVNLASLSGISEVRHHPSQDVKLSSTPILHPQHMNQLIGSLSNNTPKMATTKNDSNCPSSTMSTSMAPVNGINSANSSQITMVQSKGTTTTQPHILPLPRSSSKKPSMLISDPPAGHHAGTSNSSSQKVHGMTSQHGNELSNGVHGLSHKTPKPDAITLPKMPETLISGTGAQVSVSSDPRSSLATKSSLHSTHQLLENVARRQRHLETRTGRLLRQLRRLQSRQAISHTKQQLGGLVEHQKQALQITGKNHTGNVDLKTELMQRQNAKNMSTAALVSLIQKWQCTQTTSLRQQLSLATQEPVETTRLSDETCSELDKVAGHLECNLSHLQSGMDSDATESSSGGESCEELDDDDDWDNSASRPPIQCRAEWKWAGDRSAVAARWTWLQAQVSDLEYRIRQQYDIYKQIRASKGSVTLGEQVMPDDLLSSKGRTDWSGKKIDDKIANLQTKNEASPSNVSTLLSNVDKQSSSMSQQLGPLYTPIASPSASTTSSGSCAPTPKTPNGFVDKSSGLCVTPEDSVMPCVSRTSTGFDAKSPAPDYTCQAARCRPVRSYRKRKLLKTAGLHNVSRKAARLSTVQCHCYPPVTPCAMCGGRYNNVVSMEAETMPHMEKIALVDFSFHPVLSFPQDISLSTHFDSMLKTGEWQQKPHPKTYKVLQTERKRTKSKDNSGKYPRKLKKGPTATLLSSAKIRNKYEQKPLNSKQPDGTPVKAPPRGECKKLSRAEIRSRNRKSSENQKPAPEDASVSRDSSQSPGPQSNLLKDLWQRKKRERERGESAYDINNIVIPYSIAASTRVERLQYKEILTPKWREIEHNANNKEKPTLLGRSISEESTEEKPSKSPEEVAIPPIIDKSPEPEAAESTPIPDEEECEDLSDEGFRSRHVSCEISERKRFSLPASSSAQRRSRGAQRTDSTTSLTVTEPGSPPDPNNTTAEGSLVSQTATPPSTPQMTLHVSSMDDGEEPLRTEPPLSLSDSMRARSCSVSSSKSARSRSASCGEDKHMDPPVIHPWPLRTFPLVTKQDIELLDAETPVVEKRRSARVIAEEMTASTSSSALSEEPKKTVNPSRPVSPTPCASDCSSEAQDEDPDDPEWTVISERPAQTKQPNIVLKLSKR